MNGKNRMVSPKGKKFGSLRTPQRSPTAFTIRDSKRTETFSMYRASNTSPETCTSIRTCSESSSSSGSQYSAIGSDEDTVPDMYGDGQSTEPPSPADMPSIPASWLKEAGKTCTLQHHHIPTCNAQESSNAFLNVIFNTA